MKINRKAIYMSILLVLLISSYMYINLKDIAIATNSTLELKQDVENMEIVLGGEAIGIKLLATGVLVVGVDREDNVLNIGDIILKVNSNKITTNAELLEYAKQNNDKDITLEVSRNNEIINVDITPIFDEDLNEYRLRALG